MMNDFKVHATYGVCNYGGIAIMLSDDGGAVRYKWFEEKPTKRWQTVKYNEKGEPYIRIKNKRYYIGDFMRVSY
jgi:hypothetical protein